MRWAEYVALMEGRRDAYRIVVGRHEGERPLERPRRRWEDDNKIDLQEVGWKDMDWTDLDQDRDRWWLLVNAVMKFRIYKMRGIS